MKYYGDAKVAEISVIVPVYKVEKYLKRCVDSILRQTYSDFELILVDDGSPDRCGIICDEYAKQDERIHVIHQKNGGLSAARNAGIDWAFSNSDSEWINFIDSDDWVHPQYLEVLVNAVKRDQTAVSGGSMKWTNGEELPETIDTASKVWKTRDYYLQKTVDATVAYAKLYRKDCFRNIRYPLNKLHEDEFITYRILFEYEEISVVDQPIYAYYQNEAGIIRSKWKPGRLDAIEAMDEQTAFFMKRGDADIARERFLSLLYIIAINQDSIMESNELSGKERRKYLRQLRKQLRENLIKYRKYRWVPFWSNRPVYAGASVVLGAARQIWLKIKPFIKRK